MECWLQPISRFSLPFTPITTLSNKKKITTITNTLIPKQTKTTTTLQSPTLHHRPTATTTQLLDRTLHLLEASISDGVPVDTSTFSSLLETAFQTDHLSHGLRLHRLIPPTLLRHSAGLSSKLLRLYAVSGLMDDAHQVFDEMPRRLRNSSAFPWNSLISGYVETGLFEAAMALYYQMEEDGVRPDSFTFPRVLKACAGIGSIAIGEAVHRHAIHTGYATDPFVLNALVDMYAKCGDIVKARRVFEMIAQRDRITWNSMVTGYARHGLHREAVGVCKAMLVSGCDPDSVTISALLAGVSNSNLGREIHGWVVRHGVESSLSVSNALIAMYSECGKLKRARAVFDSMQERDTVSWNAIISAHRRCPGALGLFERMVGDGVRPDRITFVSLLSACSKLGLVEEGRRLFVEMERRYGIKAGMEHWSCMVSLLARGGFVDEAYGFVVERVGIDGGGPTVWGALLYGCWLHGNVEIGEIAAEKLFELEPDNGHNFVLMMELYRRGGREADVNKVRFMMKERGLDS